MTPTERLVLERARVGHLATADANARPHAVPICFALCTIDGDDEDTDRARLVSAIDEKPKSTTDLRRVRDVRENPRVAVVVDRYDEDWSRLAWVQVRGRAAELAPTDPGHEAAVAALRSKYQQYENHVLEERPVIEIRVGRVVSWGALEEWAAVADDGDF